MYGRMANTAQNMEKYRARAYWPELIEDEPHHEDPQGNPDDPVASRSDLGGCAEAG